MAGSINRSRNFFPQGMVRGLLLKRQLKYCADIFLVK